MKVIDSDHYRDHGIETFFFPGGEPHARIPENFGDALLFLKPRKWDDVGRAMAVLNALWLQGEKKDHKVWLFCPYFPGARQDRTDYQTPFTKRLMANILGQNVRRLYTFDIHSSVHAGIHIEHNFMPPDLDLGHHFKDDEHTHVIAPDAGAANRAHIFARNLKNSLGFRGGVEVIQAEKARDFATGKFTGFTLPPLPEVGTYIVVDDICDGGGTFNLLAEAFLKDQHGPASTLKLWVSHGIFSKGIDAIHNAYETIYTTDSWYHPAPRPFRESARVECFPLKRLVDKILEDK